MSESGTAPLPQRDIRSAANGFKRDRDSSEKWSMGSRPLAGAHVKIPGMKYDGGEYTGALLSEDVENMDAPTRQEKVRPRKQYAYVGVLTTLPGKRTNSGDSNILKSHANKTPKPTVHCETGINHSASHRMVRKVDALADANHHTASPLSKSLLELLPQHANNTATSIQTAIRTQESGILYSYDSVGASPGVKGRAVGLDSLVEMAEKKWMMEQTEKIVKGEYEVLDAEGETTVLSAKKKKGSPKQRAIKNSPAVVKNVDVEEDDGFELI